MGFGKKKTALAVRFNEDINFHNFEPFSFEDGFLIWYNPDEEAEFKVRNDELLRSMARMSPSEMEEKLGETTRGLESRLEANARIASERIRRSVAAVKAMQDLQAKQAKPLTEAIAKAYASSSASAINDAIKLGELDANYVAENIRPKDYVPHMMGPRSGSPRETRNGGLKKASSNKQSSMRKLLVRLGSSRRVITRAFSKEDIDPVTE